MVTEGLEHWHDLFVMTGGAAAALAGLLFVAVSLNLDRVLEYGSLPTLAAQSLTLLIGLVIASALALALAPQAVVAYGVELLLLGSAIAVMLVVPVVRGLAAATMLHWKVLRLASIVVAVVPLVGAGVSLTAGVGGGLFWVLAWAIIALVLSTWNAWVLLIEIRR